MSVLSAQTIRRRVIASSKSTSPISDRKLRAWQLLIEPFESESKKAFGLSYGVTAAGYDIRIGNMGNTNPDADTYLLPGDFIIFASLERIQVPHDLQVIVHDKSTWARQGLALQNTVLEPGWGGHITLELSNHGKEMLKFSRGMPIAQLIFHKLDEPTFEPYEGKYQNQEAQPVEAKFEYDTVDEALEDLNRG